MEHESDSDTNYNWCALNYNQKFGKGTGGFRNQRTSVDNPDFGIIKIGQNTEKSPGNLTTNRKKQQKRGNKNGKKNNCMDSWSEKLAK